MNDFQMLRVLQAIGYSVFKYYLWRKKIFDSLLHKTRFWHNMV